MLKYIEKFINGLGDFNHMVIGLGVMVGLLIESIKELNAKVDSLQKQLENK